MTISARTLLTDKAPAPGGPYVQGVAAGGLVIVSGQRPVDPDSGEIVAGGLTEQAQRVFANIGAVLESGGATFADVIKVSAFLADITDFDAFNTVYLQWFSPPLPARTTIAVQLRGILVEVDVWAMPGAGPARAGEVA